MVDFQKIFIILLHYYSFSLSFSFSPKRSSALALARMRISLSAPSLTLFPPLAITNQYHSISGPIACIYRVQPGVLFGGEATRAVVP